MTRISSVAAYIAVVLSLVLLLWVTSGNSIPEQESTTQADAFSLTVDT